MPSSPPKEFIIEPFVETDEIRFSDGNSQKLEWKGESEWLEVTVGVVGKLGMMHSFCPSITVKEFSDILSLEEKFQGINYLNV